MEMIDSIKLEKAWSKTRAVCESHCVVPVSRPGSSLGHGDGGPDRPACAPRIESAHGVTKIRASHGERSSQSRRRSEATTADHDRGGPAERHECWRVRPRPAPSDAGGRQGAKCISSCARSASAFTRDIGASRFAGKTRWPDACNHFKSRSHLVMLTEAHAFLQARVGLGEMLRQAWMRSDFAGARSCQGAATNWFVAALNLLWVRSEPA